MGLLICFTSMIALVIRSLAHVPPPNNYALRILRSHGLSAPQLHEVARTTTVACLMYASFSWWGFIWPAIATGWSSLLTNLIAVVFFQCTTQPSLYPMRLTGDFLDLLSRILIMFHRRQSWGVWGSRPPDFGLGSRRILGGLMGS